MKENFVITEEIKIFTELVLNREKFIFLTGVAGTGKSKTLQYLLSLSELQNKNVAILAPTAVAAINVGGQTIHSFCKLQIGIIDSKNIKKNPIIERLCSKIDILIIDEISMVRCDTFDAINETFKKNRNNRDFFGGIQIIIVGDLFQLPPIINESNGEKEALTHLGYNSQNPFFFGSRSMNDANLKIVKLTKVFRQKDVDFINLLDKIRNGSVESHEIAQINQSCMKNQQIEKHDESIIIATKNDIVKNENDKKLKEIKGKSFIYNAQINGKFDAKNAPSPEKLELKIGAKVMLTKNHTNYINGTIGIITKLGENNVCVKSDNKEILIETVTWESYEYTLSNDNFSKKVSGNFKQLPIILGYAVTIHKSQGKTFERVVIDMGNGAFASGQLYVALSRCKTLDGIFLKKNIKALDVIINKSVVEFENTEKVNNTLFS